MPLGKLKIATFAYNLVCLGHSLEPGLLSRMMKE